MTTTKSKIQSEKTSAPVPHEVLERNPGMPLDLDWIHRVHVNRSAVERRAVTIPTRRSVKKEWQAAWLLRAITCIDLTTLAGDDTPGNVKRLCAKARQPVRQELLDALGVPHLQTGAVCVYHNLVPVAVEALAGTNIPVAAVSTGFPAGQNPFDLKLREIQASVQAGAKEIDIVISRAHVLTGNWQALYDEVKAFREACGDAHMKTILATHELATLRNIAMASLVCMMAGADFIKTSTGKEPVNAILPVGLVMTRAIRDYHEETGYKVGFKPAGGIRSAKSSLDWLILMKEELGNEWLNNSLFRIGASGLLSDIERQIEHFVSGRYAAAHHNPMV
ncbi:deoxyribose-phosphate aldolase [Ktedonobacter robiniae]|uniref:deoxyribose-phosphate aldolase n=1 Tax=Ktedonobacter robiniae TaxID=2778365 RepID=UPI001915197D|nr:deoxyribose-phosphate aldolase [Ktedonobacter robiniae]